MISRFAVTSPRACKNAKNPDTIDSRRWLVRLHRLKRPVLACWALIAADHG